MCFQDEGGHFTIHPIWWKKGIRINSRVKIYLVEGASTALLAGTEGRQSYVDGGMMVEELIRMSTCNAIFTSDVATLKAQ